jgi:hypothetical protein
MLFDKTSDLLSIFNQSKELKTNIFVNPSSINKLNLKVVCRWIEGMYKAILMKWRKNLQLQNLRMIGFQVQKCRQMISVV